VEPLTVPGVEIVTVGTLALSSSTEALSITPGEVTVAINELALTSSVESASAIPGEVVVIANSLTLAGSVDAISIQVQIIIQAMALALSSSTPIIGLISVESYNETGMADIVLEGFGLDALFAFIEDIDIFVGDDLMVIEAPSETFGVSVGDDSMIVRTAK
jgi:hypothetical protein